MILNGGDKVFVTIKGFPAWPGVVEKLIEKNNQTTYTIYFFGSYDHYTCTSSSIFNYRENLLKDGKPKSTNGKLKKALEVSSKLDYPNAPKIMSPKTKTKTPTFSVTLNTTSC